MKKRKLKGSFEPVVQQILDSKKGIKAEYEDQQLPYLSYYRPDWTIYKKWGKTLRLVCFIEAKGYFRATDRAKLIKVKEYNPTANIRLVFQKDNKIHKNSNMKYSDWCEKHGFQYAIGEVPNSWLN